MRQYLTALVTIVPFLGSPALAAGKDIDLTYSTYAAGLDVAEVDVAFAIGPWSYQVSLGYRTTGVAGFFYSGHQKSQVDGTWGPSGPRPRSFSAAGMWGSQDRLIKIEYQDGRPNVLALVPPNDSERDPVPANLQANSVDSLSALAELIRRVSETGRCEAKARTFDGRRASDISATTVGEEVLPPTSRSSFSGRALRCDFTGQMIAGFMHKDDRPSDRKPLHGSAWFARVVPDGPPLPVRMSFETRWFGDATMYLNTVSRDGQAIVSGK